MKQLVKQLNKYFEENDIYIEAQDIYGNGEYAIYAFAYLDEDGNLSAFNESYFTSFKVELVYLDANDENVWDELTFDLDDERWVECLEELAEKIQDFRD